MKEFYVTTNSTIYRRLVRQRYTSCSRCSPHGGENSRYSHIRKKKAYQLDARKRHKLP